MIYDQEMTKCRLWRNRKDVRNDGNNDPRPFKCTDGGVSHNRTLYCDDSQRRMVEMVERTESSGNQEGVGFPRSLGDPGRLGIIETIPTHGFRGLVESRFQS